MSLLYWRVLLPDKRRRRRFRDAPRSIRIRFATKYATSDGASNAITLLSEWSGVDRWHFTAHPVFGKEATR